MRYMKNLVWRVFQCVEIVGGGRIEKQFKESMSSWFQTFAVFCILCVIFWVFPRRLIIGKADVSEPSVCSIFKGWIYYISSLWRWKRQSVPKRRPSIIRRRGSTQKITHKKVWVVRFWQECRRRFKSCVMICCGG